MRLLRLVLLLVAVVVGGKPDHGHRGESFRLRDLAHPKHLAVLNAVADRAGWGKPAPQGVYRGLAQMMAFNSYVAACAEISVSGGNKVKTCTLTLSGAAAVTANVQ